MGDKFYTNIFLSFFLLVINFMFSYLCICFFLQNELQKIINNMLLGTINFLTTTPEKLLVFFKTPKELTRGDWIIR